MSKSICKRVLVGLLSMILLFAISPRILSNAADKANNLTVYRNGVHNGFYTLSLNDSKAQKVTNFKSTNTKVIKIYKKEPTFNYFYNDQMRKSVTGTSIELQLLKKGSSTVSFKAGNKAYKYNITVKDYVNPIKKLTISTAKNKDGSLKNFKNTFDEAANLYSNKITLSKGGKIQVVAQPIAGWKITSITFTNNSPDGKMSNYREYKSGTTKASIRLEEYNASRQTEGSIAIELKNEKDGATQYIYARINGLDKCY